MKVLGTYFTGDGNLEKALEKLNNGLRSTKEFMVLHTDDDKKLGYATKAYIEDDHIVIEYEADENYKDEFKKEGFIVVE